MLNEALTLARELGERQLEAGILQHLALLASRRQDAASAHTLFEQSIAVRRALGRADEASMSLTFLAAVTLVQRDLETARRSIAESLELGRAMRDRRSAFTLDVLACLMAFDGRMERALVLAGASSAMHEGSGNTPPRAWDAFLKVLLQPAREALGPEAAESAWDAGRRMDYDEAVALAQATVSTTAGSSC
jgi:hypothetical protein